ncbi:unnamed protein product [Didymodactylos carnosus]|uniref:Uncharacterized protein n=1 Tax=Didymodactylos carnosus TaxID=1234261 RepID=A0A814SC35_9BILA|nr:unnamed protein product [Didymodactylos carnosus]CAF1146085.1 unnamed protein product [Didymodactylos carnosus]CAF3759147.1 unnamed protein product [Didymodactylos carnosus]CAF3909688.1 unnamed protein product [Didymodactylos carnosus]
MVAADVEAEEEDEKKDRTVRNEDATVVKLSAFISQKRSVENDPVEKEYAAKRAKQSFDVGKEQTYLSLVIVEEVLNGWFVLVKGKPRIFGGHSPRILRDHSNYHITQRIQRGPNGENVRASKGTNVKCSHIVNRDGTITVRFRKVLGKDANGKLLLTPVSKTSTLFPANWSDEQIVNSAWSVLRQDSSHVDNRLSCTVWKSLHRGVIDGIEIAVIVCHLRTISNERIQMFSLNKLPATGTTVIFNAAYSTKIYVDDENDGQAIYVSLLGDNCVKKWVQGASHGVQVGGPCPYCEGVWVDKEKNVYMSSAASHCVFKWSPRTNTTTVVAGREYYSGSTSDNLNSPEGIYVDGADGTVYVADYANNRIQKWLTGAHNGTTVAGLSTGNEGSDAESLSRPTSVWVDDETQAVYVADSSNERIQRWLHNASIGDTIAGGSDAEWLGVP